MVTGSSIDRGELAEGLRQHADTGRSELTTLLAKSLSVGADSIVVSKAFGGTRQLLNRLGQRGVQGATELVIFLDDDPVRRQVNVDYVVSAMRGESHAPTTQAPVAFAYPVDGVWQLTDLVARNDSKASSVLTREIESLKTFRVEVDSLEDDLHSLFEEILDLQGKWAKENTPEMSRRGDLVRSRGPIVIERLLANIGHGMDLQVEGSDGKGLKARVPWIRIFDPRSSSSARDGWYLVYLFAADGSSVFLSIGHAATGDNHARLPLEEIDAERDRALGVLGRHADLARFSSPIALHDAGANGLGYERASAGAIRYQKGAVPGEASLLSDLSAGLDLLNALYSASEIVDNAGSVSNVMGVYAGAAAASNFQVGVDAATWGWADEHDEARTLHVGDYLVLAQGGGGRLQLQDWVTRTASAVVLARVTRELYQSGEELWPDEKAGERRYPHRVGFEVEATVEDFAYEKLPLEVNKLLQTSATKQGRGFVAPVDELELLAAFGVKPVEIVEPAAPDAVLRAFNDALRGSGLVYGTRHDQLAASFVSALVSKPFLILTGLSGSGKTRLAMALGQWLGKERMHVVAVRPDWTSPESLLGFENLLSDNSDGHAWSVPDSLEFMLRAHHDPGSPYLLILDEMNLAHVERYFADLLSGMESGAPVLPNLERRGDAWRLAASSEPKLPVPSNLFVVGTVNVDETTYMFSPKVLDRANTIEFRVETSDLNAQSRPPAGLPAAEPELVAGFVEMARDDAPIAGDDELVDWLTIVHELLSASGREFGHRTFFESREFVRKLRLANPDQTWEGALDFVVLQKLLPRLHGSRSDLGPLVDSLSKWCEERPEHSAAEESGPWLPLSYDKLQRMSAKLKANHFASFAE